MCFQQFTVVSNDRVLHTSTHETNLAPHETSTQNSKESTTCKALKVMEYMPNPMDIQSLRCLDVLGWVGNQPEITPCDFSVFQKNPRVNS